MDTTTIFITDSLVADIEPFEHGHTRFVFAAIGSDGPQRLAEGPIYVFIDWMLHDMAGLELCRRVRADGRMDGAHITMVLEEDDEEDRRRALKAGADDYLVGPLDRTTILDRVLALRSPVDQHFATRVIEVGRLRIDMGALQARWQDKPLALRPNEFRLLRFFAENPNRVLSRENLIAGLGKQDMPLDERTVDVWVGRLRRALKAAGATDTLRTVRSLGYVYDAD